jgi:hypothetical protein
MKISNLPPWVQHPVAIATASLLSSLTMSHRAYAHDDLWSSRTAPVRPSAEKILLVDNPDSTITAMFQIEYAGPSRNFAWVIPVPGKPTVGVSSNAVFRRLDAATAPQYWVEVTVEGTCMQDSPDAGLDAGSRAGGAPSTNDFPPTPVVGEASAGAGHTKDPPSAGAVQVIDQGSIGPYDYVNIAVDPTVGDGAKVATDWLATNGYDPASLEGDALRRSLRDGLHLLAFKLTPDGDVGAIRPVILTYESKLPTLPISPGGAAARGVEVWILGPTQAVPDNAPSLVVNDALLDWSTGRKYVAGTLPAGGVGPFDPYNVSKPSNYEAVVSAAAREAGGQGFVTEVGAPASQYRGKVWSSRDDQHFATLSHQRYADGIDAVFAANDDYHDWDGWQDAVERATTLPAGVRFEDFGRHPAPYRGVAKVDTTRFFQLLDEEVVRPVADAAAMLQKAPYLTRLYSPMPLDGMAVAPAFNYDADLALVSDIHIARQSLRCAPTIHPYDAPWSIQLPQGGVIVGKGGEWPVAMGSMPANLKLVQLSTAGSGAVIKDNSDVIRAKLLKTANTTALKMPHPPQNGLTIGGTQTLIPHDPTGSTQGLPRPLGGNACSVSRAGAGASSPLALWLPQAGMILALRRRSARRRRRSGTKPRNREGIGRAGWACLLLAGCGHGGAAPAQGDAGAPVALAASGTLTRAQLLDPETCKGCHPMHYREWSSSMHAYAARDPVFLAMNKRGQRETHGKLGDFCIRCHAPMAVIDKTTRDGLDLERLPDKDRGVSCYFCHNVTGVEGDHNAMLHLANDTTMRGPIRDPVQPRVHQVELSEMFDNLSPTSTAVWGGCHDIVTPDGVHLERTLEEYRSGIFSKSATGAPPAFDSCVGCHMPPRQGLAAIAPAGAPLRSVHEHLWPGVDVPLTPFPHRDALRSAVEDCQLRLASVSFFTLEVTPPDLFSFQIETLAGHNEPSGAAQDRRMWLEFMAYDKSGQLLEPVSSGHIADGEIEDRPDDDPKRDPHLLMLRDRIYDARDKPVHMFWQAAMSTAHPDGYESNVVPVATTSYIDGTHALLKQYRASGPDGLPARVTARLRIRPIGLDVLQDLVDSGDLDPAIVAQMPTLTFGAQIEWTPGRGLMKTVSASRKADCTTYRCLLDPQSCP